MRPDHKIINHHFSLRQQRNPNYSWRAFARDLQISPSTLCEWLKGRHLLSERSLCKILAHLDLNPEERQILRRQQNIPLRQSNTQTLAASFNASASPAQFGKNI